MALARWCSSSRLNRWSHCHNNARPTKRTSASNKIGPWGTASSDLKQISQLQPRRQLAAVEWAVSCSLRSLVEGVGWVPLLPKVTWSGNIWRGTHVGEELPLTFHGRWMEWVHRPHLKATQMCGVKNIFFFFNYICCDSFKSVSVPQFFSKWSERDWCKMVA